MIESTIRIVRHGLVVWCVLGLLPGVVSGQGSERAGERRLRFSPEAPLSNSHIQVTYTPIERLAGEQELVLRGHFRTEHDRMYNGGLRNTALAKLEPEPNGTFAASFTLPAQVVYAAFVVEDKTGQRIDANGRDLFELLIHAEDGQPLYHSLMQRAYDFAGRNWITAYESNRLAMELYPDSLAGWSTLRFHEDVALGSTGSDSLLAWHQENFAGIHEEYARRTPLSPATVVAIQGYADDVEDSVAVAFWTERARNEGRGTRSWAQIVGIETVQKFFGDRDADAALAAFEEYWPDAEGTGSQMLSWALNVATEWNRAPDLPAADRWIERMLADGGSKFSAARRLASFPERRERALELARQGLERSARAGTEHADLVAHPGRPLGRTVSEYARTRARQWADRLVTYSELLSAAGEEDEALEALEEAAATAVDPEVFQRLADVKLSRGDTAGAARDYAVIAADPLTHADQADSLAALVGQNTESPEWHTLLESAEARMLPRIVADTVRWAPRSSSLADKNGNRVLLSDLIEGRNTVLVFWARSCGYSVAEIPQVVRLRELLESTGVQILSITTDDQPGPDMEEFIAARGVTYPVYYDLAAEAKNAFGVSGIPSYFILDASGRVRFAFSQVADIARQVEALVQLRGNPPPEP
ncbi:MAG: TlpA disulfide reductase family protein [Gemmatimonadota bacterium]|nr:TlpA disulfide reductase family protein [Gammaproteobacteria bacterium]MDE2784377.1 TlpA disulfide reductase family protein [Gemmatimonadota bacterium]